MFTSSGKSHRVSPFRRLVADLLHFSAHVPSVSIERRMKLAPLVNARNAASPKPSWSTMFTKAYALVAAQTPALRTSYLKFPWPRLYEHAANIATLNVNRDVNGESVVLYAHVPSPESLSLAEIDALVRRFKEEPVENIPSYRNARRMSAIPWPFRRLAWWGGLNVFGGLRAHHYGTFGLTTICNEGAAALHITPILTSSVHYGMFDAAGNLDMRLTFDHRVFDGVTGARALVSMERLLLTTILNEVQGKPQAAAA